MILHSANLIDQYTREGYWRKERTLLDQFRENCWAHPQRRAIVDPPNRAELAGTQAVSVTYAELDRAVQAMAFDLVERGLCKGDIVVAQLPNVWELGMLYLAVARAGGVLTALPLQWRQRDVGYVAELTEARFYIGAERYRELDYTVIGRELGFEQVLTLGEVTDIARGEPRGAVDVPVDPNDAFTLCWTSGTESDPKGCPLSHNNWLFFSDLLLRVVGVQSGDRQLCVAPLVNMTAMGVNYVPWLLTAGTLVLHHPLTPEILIRQLVDEQIQFTILVPAVLNMVVKRSDVDELDLSSVRTITTGSAPPSAFTMQEFKRRWDIDIINIWGQNEGTSLVAGPQDVPQLDMRVDHFPWWGRAGCHWPSGMQGISVKLLDDEGREVTKPGGIGELCCRSPGLFPGYFRRPDLTAKAFTADGYFRTGDLFRVQDRCFIGFHDRKKDIVIRGGFNISSAEVENAVQAHTKVQDCAVVPVQDEVMGERVCVCVVPKDADDPPTLESITGYLKEQGMSLYKLPEHLRLLDEIPRNPVGKILKNQLA